MLEEFKNSLREMVTPVTYPASLITGFIVVEIESSEIRNPLYKEGETAEPKYVPAVELVQKMINAGWELSRASLIRKDDCYCGMHEAAVHERFVLVFVKKRV